MLLFVLSIIIGVLFNILVIPFFGSSFIPGVV